jgi:DNA (cytosine-5)-methyltransferase 1
MALQLRELALFAGAGGGILGGHVLGWRTVCAVEFAAYPRSVLLARQRDGMLSAFPVWDDVRTFDGKPWRGSVDVITGGFPCQDISVAGKGDGLDGERSGLWSEMARIIGEVQPRFAFVENSPMLTSRGLDRVLGDLSTLGYDAEWGVVGADDAGAPHRRERIWILAYADPDLCGRLHGQTEEQPAAEGVHAQREPEPSGEDVADAAPRPLQDGQIERGVLEQTDSGWPAARSINGGLPRNEWWSVEPGLGGVADELADRLDIHGTPEPGSVPRVATGIPKRADRLKAIGNGQVPAAAVLAWRTLYNRITT